jgi:membrane protein
MKLTPRTVAWLLRRSVIASFDDNCFSIAKGAAYSSLLSLFPVLTSAATILVQTHADFVARQLERVLQEIVPPGTANLVMQHFQASGERHIWVFVVATLVSLWAASSVFKSLIEGFQAAYRVPRNRDFVHSSAIAMSLVLLSAIPLICASLLILFGGRVETLVLGWIKVNPVLTPYAWVWEVLSRLARYAVAFSTTVALTATLYYFGPNRRQRWRYVWPGAIVATVLWLLATSGFAWYAGNIGHYNVMYGSIGAGIALLVWMYLLAAIALIGCEFNAEYERAER